MLTATEAKKLVQSEAEVNKRTIETAIDKIEERIIWECERGSTYAAVFIDGISVENAQEVIKQLKDAGYAASYSRVKELSYTSFEVDWE